MSYATPAHLMARKDVRRLGELVRDDDTRATPFDLATDANLQAALDDASGRIDAAMFVGQRYLPTDLVGLNPAGNSFKFLVRITCDLAYGYLLERRGYSLADITQAAPGYAEALQTLDRLKDGLLVFDVQAAEAAGVPSGVRLSRQVTLITDAAVRYFGYLDNNYQFIPH